MRQIIKSEVLKLLYNKKNIVCLILIVIVTFGICLYYQNMDHNYDEQQMNEYIMIEKYADSQITSLYDQKNFFKANGTLSDEANAALEKDIQFWQNNQLYAIQLRNYFKNRESMDDKAYMKLQMEYNHYTLNGLKQGYEMNVNEKDIQIINEQNDIFTYLMQHDIALLHSPYTMNVTNFLTRIFDNHMILIYLLITMIMMSDTFAGEFESSCYKWIFSAPVSRIGMLMMKLLFVLIFALLSILLSIGLISIYAMLTHGFGNFQYPIWISHDEIISSQSYMINSFVLHLNYLVCMLTISAFLALFMKSYANLYLCMGVILLIVYYAPSLLGTNNILSSIPLFYANGFAILHKQVMISTLQANISCIGVDVIVIGAMMAYLRKLDL